MNRPQIEELVATALASGDIDGLAVAADALQEAGDSRGEALRLELQLAETPEAAELSEALTSIYRENLPSWLPPSLGSLAENDIEIDGEFLGAKAIVHTAGGMVGFCAGLLVEGAISYESDTPVLTPSTLLDPSECPHLQCVSLSGRRERFADVVTLLAARRRPRLRRLSLTSDGRYEEDDAFLVDARLSKNLHRALVGLQSLSITGRRLLESFSHPGIEELVISGIDAIGSLAASTLPKLRRFDLAFNSGYMLEHIGGRDAGARRIIETILRASSFRVAEIDLSRNEPGCRRPTHHGGNVSAYAALGAVGRSRHHRPQRVRMPSPRTAQDLEDLEAALREKRAARITIARSYPGYPSLEPLLSQRPELELEATYPWPPPEQHGREALAISLADERYPVHVDLRGIVVALERFAFELRENSERMAGWARFWQALAELPYEDESGRTVSMTVPFDELADGLAPIEAAECDGRIIELLTTMVSHRGCCPGTDVTIERYWGW